MLQRYILRSRLSKAATRLYSSTAAMSKSKVLLLGSVDQAKDSWASLTELADVVTPASKSRADFIAEARSGAFDGCLAAYRTFPSFAVTGPLDAELLGALPSSLRFIAHCGAGYDQIDTAACSARDPPVKLSNVPEAADDATADTAVWLILGALRGFNPSLLAARRGEFKGKTAPPLGRDPQGKTLGILGMGGIGRNLKKKMEVFGMTTIYHNRNKLSEEMAAGAEYVSFDELLARSDVLSLNLPMNKHTRHIIGAPEFAKMKHGVVIVNTARGPVMDEAALVAALQSGQVYSAGLDVYEKEPEIHAGLIAAENALLLPHMGTYSVETIKKMESVAVANVRSAIETGALKTPVWEHRE